MEVNRFSISSYMDHNKPEEGAGVNSAKFNQLVSKSQESLQERLNSKELQEVFKNKSVSMLFLDKISKLLGTHHPDSVEVRKFMGGPTVFPSIELIWRLSNLLNHPDLSENTVLALENWIDAERALLPIGIIFDAWGAISEEAVIRSTTKGGFESSYTPSKIEPPKEEMRVFANAMANEMKAMRPGDKFKMPAGSVQHVTRLEFTKKNDGSFDIIHFNTGLGVFKINDVDSTACKYRSVAARKLEDPRFWRQLAETKMQGDMEALNNLLKTKELPEDLSRWVKKPLQDSGSCSFRAAEAEFKYSFINSFPSVGEGWAAYKLCTSLMATQALEEDLEPAIERALIAKEASKSRYQEWIKDPEKHLKIHMDALAALKKDDIQQIVDKLPPLMALHVLDKRLNERLDVASFEQLTHIRNTFGDNLVYKQLKWLEATREVMRDVVEFSGIKGKAILKIRSLSASLLPSSWNRELQTRLNFAILDPESLTPLLSEYLLREDPAIGSTFKIENFKYDGNIIYKHIKANPERALELAHLPMEGKEKVIKRAFQKMLDANRVETALQVISLLEGEQVFMLTELCKRGLFDIAIQLGKENLGIIAFELSKTGKTKRAMDLIRDLPASDLARVINQVVFRLCNDSQVNNALTFVTHIPRDFYQNESHMAIEDAYQRIVVHLIQANRRHNAQMLAMRIPDGPLKTSITHLADT